MLCEMCGKDVEEHNLFYVKVEGTTLKLCKGCSKYGNVMKSVGKKKAEESKAKERFVRKTRQEEKEEEIIVEDYAEKIKNIREKQEIKQEDFAKEINEKESLIHKIETGHIKPSIKLAKKIEKKLGIKLIEMIKFQEYRNFNKKSGAETPTIGDMIQIKHRKK